MKAAVIDHAGGVPHYQDVPDPTVEEGQVRITVEAVAVENVDRAIVAGTLVGFGGLIAAVLSSAISAAISLLVASEFKPGETVLIQGATGVAGRLAVKVARLLGESAGPAIQLTGDAVRTSGLEIYGAARNAATGMAAAYQQVVDWVRNGELTIDLTTMPLSQVEKAWTRTDL
jgi:NADPH:quinone reductase-like Zn-dependent oxidoreductase